MRSGLRWHLYSFVTSRKNLRKIRLVTCLGLLHTSLSRVQMRPALHIYVEIRRPQGMYGTINFVWSRVWGLVTFFVPLRSPGYNGKADSSWLYSWSWWCAGVGSWWVRFVLVCVDTCTLISKTLEYLEWKSHPNQGKLWVSCGWWVSCNCKSL